MYRVSARAYALPLATEASALAKSTVTGKNRTNKNNELSMKSNLDWRFIWYLRLTNSATLRARVTGDKRKLLI
jgi:hypothetical protein